jgi:two-component system chemotaxis sensor kinase CheA
VAHQKKLPPDFLASLEEIAEAPASQVFSNLSDAFISTCAKLNKLATRIEWLPSVQIRPDMYQELFRSFIHVVQNAADHGIESADVREKRGKPEAGRLVCQLSIERDFYKFALRDDGEGINYNKIKTKAKDLKLAVPNSPEECHKLILSGNFSTKDQVTETSGRGVGLEAVDSEARKFGGRIEIKSIPENGTEIIVYFRHLRGDTSAPLQVSARAEP